MDLISNRTKDIGAMALDGLWERSRAISANTANALTPNYQRKEVSFEQSLQNIIKRENEKEEMKIQNSIAFQKGEKNYLAKSPEELSFLSSNIKDGFSINIENDMSDAIDTDGNNVDIEVEMMDEARCGMQYQVVSNLLSKSYSQLNAVIRGQS